MTKILARKMDDGLYHYGMWVQNAPASGQLIAIEVSGTGQIPEFPSDPATEEAHLKWLADLERAGFEVNVKDIKDEPTV